MTDEQMDALAAKCWRESRYSGRDGQDFDHRDFARQVLAAAAVVQASVPAGMPCTVCGVPYDKHGTYPTCASHPYTPDRMCRHVIGAACVGAECKNGCVRTRKGGV